MDVMRHNYAKQRDSAGDLEYFISKFECRVEDSREYNQYVRPAPYYRDVCASDDWRMETKITPMKAIHLTSDNLARLVAEQERMEHMKSNAELGIRMWDQQCRDQMVRDNNHAVDKAYQKYQILLELARK
jgi:hypothetical protein